MTIGRMETKDPATGLRQPGRLDDAGRPRRGGRLRRSRVLRAVLVVAVVGCVMLAFSIVPALTAPGTDSTSARLAEWARVHRMGWLVTDLEKAQYRRHKPAVGGTVRGGIPTVAAPAPVLTTTPAAPRPAASSVSPYALPSAIVPPVADPLPGEGKWQTLWHVSGHPAAAVAFVRPDAVHTSYLVAVVWMSSKLLRFPLHPGYQVPGGPLPAPDQLSPAERASVFATFNSGFQMVDANGGYWQQGTTVTPLRAGAASMVLEYGRAPSDRTMARRRAAVRCRGCPSEPGPVDRERAHLAAGT